MDKNAEEEHQELPPTGESFSHSPMFGNDGFEEHVGDSSTQEVAGDIHRPFSSDDSRAFQMLGLMQLPTEMLQWKNIDKRTRRKRVGHYFTQVTSFVIFFYMPPTFPSSYLSSLIPPVFSFCRSITVTCALRMPMTF